MNEMPMQFLLNGWLPMHELFDGCLQKYGIFEDTAPAARTGPDHTLTDGVCGYLTVSEDQAGYVYFFFGSKSESNLRILRTIAFHFNVEIFSENEPQFFGCDTDEEVDAKLREL